jgi:hypothetical protein
MIKRGLALLLLAGLPLVSFAQTLNLSPLQSLIGAIAKIVGAIVPILVTLALVVFFWGLVRYLWGAGGKAGVAKGKSLMLWGLVTLFVMVSVWGIIDLMQSALNIDKNAQGRAPQIMYPGASGYTSANPAGTNGPLFGPNGYTP